MSSSDFKIKLLKYNSSLRQKWLDGTLQREWYKDYPQLFDGDDFSIALNQKNNHFGEWYTAIHYFKKGWRVLIEHYAYSREKTSPFYTIREKKNEEVKRLLGREGFDFLRYLGGKKRQVRPPDLFIFNQKSKFFFAEVKWGQDKLRDYQKKLFRQIIKKFGVKIELVYVFPK